MATQVRTGADVVSFLKSQHHQLRAGFAEVADSAGERRRDAFSGLRRLLAVHETAEEEIVHPAARSKVPNGEAVVKARLQEESAAKDVLSDLEKLDVDSAEFDRKLTVLRKAVLAHAESEERLEFEPLGDHLDEKRLEQMRKAVSFAESVAPTRPHGTESAAGNMLAGPFASMLDRARDAIEGKS